MFGSSPEHPQEYNINNFKAGAPARSVEGCKYKMKANTVTTVFDDVVNLDGKIFVWFTDKFLSG